MSIQDVGDNHSPIIIITDDLLKDTGVVSYSLLHSLDLLLLCKAKVYLVI